MARHAFVFPGQGSQSVGMGKELFEAFPVARAVFDEIDDTLSFHLSRLMFDGEPAELTATENTQPALFAVSMAVVRVLESEGGFSLKDKASYVAGHSLGEYAALTSAGVLSLSDAARLLRLRGQAMQQAVPAGEGGMAALLGIDPEKAAALCSHASQGDVLEVANDNGGGQIVVSGHMEAVERIIEAAKAEGVRRVVKLPVSAPFHSSLMEPAAQKMQEALEQVSFQEASIPVIANVTAQPVTSPDDIKKLLVRQVTGQVRWRETIESLASYEVTHHHELGAGKVLTGLARRIAPDMHADYAGKPVELDAMLKSL